MATTNSVTAGGQLKNATEEGQTPKASVNNPPSSEPSAAKAAGAVAQVLEPKQAAGAVAQVLEPKQAAGAVAQVLEPKAVVAQVLEPKQAAAASAGECGKGSAVRNAQQVEKGAADRVKQVLGNSKEGALKAASKAAGSSKATAAQQQSRNKPGDKEGTVKEGPSQRRWDNSYRAAMMDRLHALKTPLMGGESYTKRPLPQRSESAFPLHVALRPFAPQSPAVPASDRHRSNSGRPDGSFRSVSRMRGGVDPAAPPSNGRILAEEKVLHSEADAVDSVDRRVAHRRSASRRPNPQAASASILGAIPEAPRQVAARRPSNPGAAAHRMSPSARSSAWARSIVAACNNAEPSPPASRQAVRQ